MKKILTTGLIAISAMTMANAGDAYVSQDVIKEITAGTAVFKNPNLKILKAIDKDTVYFLKVNATSPKGSRDMEAFYDKKTKAVYFGGGVDKTGKQIKFPIDADIIKNGISFSTGTGSKEIYVVTDPECPYCSKFEKASTGKLDDYTVHYVMMPLGFHKKAPGMLDWVLQAKTDLEKKERLEKVMVGKDQTYTKSPTYIKYQADVSKAKDLAKQIKAARTTKDEAKAQKLIAEYKKLNIQTYPYSPEAKKSIMASEKAARELGATGTPSVFGSNFERIEWPTLLNVR